MHASSQVEHDGCINEKVQRGSIEHVKWVMYCFFRGIGPADVKVKAVDEEREPRTSAEVCVFLGFVNYSSRSSNNLCPVALTEAYECNFYMGKI